MDLSAAYDDFVTPLNCIYFFPLCMLKNYYGVARVYSQT
jgi:hypothetical protein